MIEYTPRYSPTDEPDHMGRWARLAHYNGILIAWISRHDVEGIIKFCVVHKLPMNGNDSPYESPLFDTYRECQEEVSDYLKRFLNKINIDPTPVKAMQDDSGHWYLIPNDIIDEFRILSDTENIEEENMFIDKFSKYMTGGDLNLVQLYIAKEC